MYTIIQPQTHFVVRVWGFVVVGGVIAIVVVWGEGEYMLLLLGGGEVNW